MIERRNSHFYGVAKKVDHKTRERMRRGKMSNTFEKLKDTLHDSSMKMNMCNILKTATKQIKKMDSKLSVLTEECCRLRSENTKHSQICREANTLSVEAAVDDPDADPPTHLLPILQEYSDEDSETEESVEETDTSDEEENDDKGSSEEEERQSNYSNQCIGNRKKMEIEKMRREKLNRAFVRLRDSLECFKYFRSVTRQQILQEAIKHIQLITSEIPLMRERRNRQRLLDKSYRKRLKKTIKLTLREMKKSPNILVPSKLVPLLEEERKRQTDNNEVNETDDEEQNKTDESEEEKQSECDKSETCTDENIAHQTHSPRQFKDLDKTMEIEMFGEKITFTRKELEDFVVMELRKLDLESQNEDPGYKEELPDRINCVQSEDDEMEWVDIQNYDGYEEVVETSEIYE